MYCKDCKYWQRYSKDNKEVSETNEKRGKCSSDKFIDTSYWTYWDEDGNEVVLGADDTLEYHDYECYQASFSTGENFGCIHFEKKVN